MSAATAALLAAAFVERLDPHDDPAVRRAVRRNLTRKDAS